LNSSDTACGKWCSGLDHGPSAATGLRDDIRRGFESGVPAARNDQQGDARPLDLAQLPLERRFRRDPSSGKALAKPSELLGVRRTPQFGGDAHELHEALCPAGCGRRKQHRHEDAEHEPPDARIVRGELVHRWLDDRQRTHGRRPLRRRRQGDAAAEGMSNQVGAVIEKLDNPRGGKLPLE